jgi:hypothetical protein
MRKKSILAIESIYNDFWLNCNQNFGVSQAPNPENMANSSVANLDTASLRQFLLDALVRLAYREGNFTLSYRTKQAIHVNGKQVTLTAEELSRGAFIAVSTASRYPSGGRINPRADTDSAPLLWYLPTKIARFQL